MEIQVGLITRWDNEPQTDFPHSYSAWADGGAVSRYFTAGDLSRHKYDGIEQTRTVTTEGLRPPVRGLLAVAPPRYPPVRIDMYDCDDSLLAVIQGNAAYMILNVEDIGNGVPPAAEDRAMNDPLPEDVFNTLRDKIETLTRAEVGDDQADQWVVAANNWWANTDPAERTPKEFYLAVKRFTS